MQVIKQSLTEQKESDISIPIKLEVIGIKGKYDIMWVTDQGATLHQQPSRRATVHCFIVLPRFARQMCSTVAQV